MAELTKAWARKERRESMRLAVIAYCSAAAAGGKVKYEEVLAMMPMPADPDDEEGGNG
jgi:hypothetical protein